MARILLNKRFVWFRPYLPALYNHLIWGRRVSIPDMITTTQGGRGKAPPVLPTKQTSPGIHQSVFISFVKRSLCLYPTTFCCWLLHIDAMDSNLDWDMHKSTKIWQNLSLFDLAVFQNVTSFNRLLVGTEYANLKVKYFFKRKDAWRLCFGLIIMFLATRG